MSIPRPRRTFRLYSFDLRARNEHSSPQCARPVWCILELWVLIPESYEVEPIQGLFLDFIDEDGWAKIYAWGFPERGNLEPIYLVFVHRLPFLIYILRGKLWKGEKISNSISEVGLKIFIFCPVKWWWTGSSGCIQSYIDQLCQKV